MKKLFAVVLAALLMPAVALAAEWKNVSMVDAKCQAKVAGDPDKHPASCALKCADSGFSIKTADGAWVKLDDAGNKLAVTELKNTKKKDHVRVDVMGEQKGDVIAVSSLKMAN